MNDEMKVQKAFFIKLLRWAIFYVTVYWILLCIIRQNPYRKADRDWLHDSMERNETSSIADPINSEKIPEHLTFYKTLPQKDTKP